MTSVTSMDHTSGPPCLSKRIDLTAPRDTAIGGKSTTLPLRETAEAFWSFPRSSRQRRPTAVGEFYAECRDDDDEDTRERSEATARMYEYLISTEPLSSRMVKFKARSPSD